ncbi:class I SAM-dependent methyltransferase [Aquipuribacter sp. SD81]|uniref:class I SAM-dependent methyltransferase n=1 Tax=Aquipuribacter sp. SD81 TaxID=3127703 RepID=UPI003017F333
MSEQQPHYFDADPAAPARARELSLDLDGRAVRVRTAAGVFSGDRLDPGTAVLLRSATDVPAGGDLLDLGCGWGPLALALAARAPAATVWAVDVNARARALTAENAALNGLTNVRVAAPEDVDPALRFAAVWSNPPIRIGKAALHDLLRLWLPRLATGGHADLVVQRNLGADSLHRWLADGLDDPAGLGAHLATTRLASSKGYRVLRVRRDVSG